MVMLAAAGTMASSLEHVFLMGRELSGGESGYSNTGLGSLSPTGLNGSTIGAIQTDSSELLIRIGGLRDKDFFSLFRCSLGIFLTADSTHSQFDGTTFWTWNLAEMFPGSGSENVVFNL